MSAKALRFSGSVLTATVLSFCLVTGAIMCLVSAFSLTVQTNLLILTILGLSLFWILLSHVPKTWWVVHVLVAAAVLVRLYFQLDALIASIQTVYTALRNIYVAGYNWPLPLWTPDVGTDCTLALAVVITPMTFFTARAVYRRRSLLLPLLVDSIAVFLCFVVTDSPPDPLWRNLFLVALGTALLSQAARRLDSGGARLTWLAAPVVLALVLVIQGLLPSEDYCRSSFGQTILSNLLDWTSRVAAIDVDSVFGDLDIHVPVNQTENLNIGPRNNSGRTIIEVRSQKTGSLYLRGTTYGVYTGTSWDFLPEVYYNSINTAPGLMLNQATQTSTVSIRTRYVEPTIYTPYYLGALPKVGEPWADICIENTGKLREYAILHYTAPPDISSHQHLGTTVTGTATTGQHFSDLSSHRIYGDFSEYDNFVSLYYTDLPQATRQSALSVMQDLGLTLEQLLPMETADIVTAVSTAVRNSATYDLNTPRMPEGSDFAIWFLSESDTGYCVHFASATAVLLRSLGIPARYVTGYLVDTQAGKWVDVSAQNAHAWTEYYIAGVGWLPVESTPGNTAIIHGAPQETDPTEPSTQPQPDRTQPSEETAPAPSTAPQITQSTTSPSEAPTQSPTDSGPGYSGSIPAVRIPGWLWWLLALLVLGVLQRPVRIRLRQIKLSRLSPKARFLHRWRRVCRMAELLKEPIRHEDLAEKARFSAHSPSGEEEQALFAWERHLQTVSTAGHWYIRLLLRWILVWT